ncbi:hypothetical protein [Belnapia sp. F-4-1]|uniref:hypothetical protein n=1 Tax=Belnapia sp. F-4-1 TaxID=1545443 RepID=UPI001364ADC4|nr:hypothetical protein [Belnapia sp. F-4-1]
MRERAPSLHWQPSASPVAGLGRLAPRRLVTLNNAEDENTPRCSRTGFDGAQGNSFRLTNMLTLFPGNAKVVKEYKNKNNPMSDHFEKDRNYYGN